MKKACVLGGGGFIGSHLVKRLKSLGYWVSAVDLKKPQYSKSAADEFKIIDLRDTKKVQSYFEKRNDFEVIFQLAADMGGAAFVFTGENDSAIMHNSAMINLNVLEAVKKYLPSVKIFYSSSACMYPQHNQMDPENPKCSQDSAYPAGPDSEYGWQKLFSERLYLAYRRNYGIKTYIARFHNIFGPEGTWTGGRQKSPAAMCRKIATTKHIDNKVIEVWGKGDQTRSFLIVDQCIDGILRLVASESFFGPVNIGSEQMISINNLAKMVIDISGLKEVTIKNVDGPTGVRGRNSDNKLIRQKLGWEPAKTLRQGMQTTYRWIKKQVDKKARKDRHLAKKARQK